MKFKKLKNVEATIRGVLQSESISAFNPRKVRLFSNATCTWL